MQAPGGYDRAHRQRVALGLTQQFVAGAYFVVNTAVCCRCILCR